MWWIKKKKKICKCPCHWSALKGTFYDQTKHCEICTEQIKAARRLKKTDPAHQRRKIKAELHDITSLIIRIKADWTCVKCKRKYPPVISPRTGLPGQNLMTTSHYWGRGEDGTSWDERNLDAMCLFCHQKVENHKHEEVEGFNYEFYMKQKLGLDGYNLLDYKAHTPTKFTTIELNILLQEKKKELQILLTQYA